MFPPHNVSYHDIPTDEKDADSSSFGPSETGPMWLTLRKAILLISLAAMAIFATVFAAVGAAIAHHESSSRGFETAVNHTDGIAQSTQESSLVPEPFFVDCGRSPMEAISRGCKFDISSFAWLTPQCYDESLVEDFVQWSNWTWYLSEQPDNETQITYEQAKKGELNTFVDWTYHMVHCTFMWRLQHRSMEKGWIARHLVHYDHTMHCQHSLLQDAHGKAKVRTPARVVFPPCLKIGTGEGMYPGVANEAGLSW